MLSSSGESSDTEVNPGDYSTFSRRQIAQLSLRRLGETPKPFACHAFIMTIDGKFNDFVPPTPTIPRHRNVQNIRIGMDAGQVLSLIGSPDFISVLAWSYDIDAPGTLHCDNHFRGAEGHRRQERGTAVEVGLR